MFLSFLLYVLSFVPPATTDKVEVLNYTYVPKANHSLAVFNFNNGQNTTNTLTTCTWAKPLNESVYVFSMPEKFSDQILFYGIYKGQIAVRVFDLIFQTNQTCKLLNSWIHLCLRIQGQETDVFLYGRPIPFKGDSVRNDNKQILLNSVIEIGSLIYEKGLENGSMRAEEDSAWVFQFVGEFYEYNVWKKALSETEIKKLVNCPSPNMEGDLVAWSKLINGVKNGDKDIKVNPRVTTLTEEGPCPTVKKLVCSGNGSGDEGEDDSGDGSEDDSGDESENVSEGESEDDSGEDSGNLESDSYQSGNSDSGKSSAGLVNPGSSSDQSGNSNPGTSPSSSSGGIEDAGSSSDQSGNSNPGTSPSSSSGGIEDPGSSSDQSGNSNPGTSPSSSSGGIEDAGSSSDQSGNSNPGTSPSSSSGGIEDPGSSSDQSGNSNPSSSSRSLA